MDNKHQIAILEKLLADNDQKLNGNELKVLKEFIFELKKQDKTDYKEVIRVVKDCYLLLRLFKDIFIT